jgi:hypothetical protein
LLARKYLNEVARAFGDNNHDISASEQLWLILFKQKEE